jgi:hypothetical protein
MKKKERKGFMSTEVLMWVLIIIATAFVIFMAIKTFSSSGFSLAESFKKAFNFKA